MKRTPILSSALLLCALCATATARQPAPLVSLGENMRISWTQAMDSGRLKAVNPEMDGTPDPAMDFYMTQGQTAFVTPALTPDLMATLQSDRGISEETHLSLVMQWNPPMQGETIAAASWEYDTLNLDRVGGLDLRTGMIHFSLGAPPGVWDVGVLLKDKEDRWAGWFMPMPPLGWTQQWIDTSLGAQDDWQYFQDPGFDISNVVAVRLNEAGAMVTFPAPPPGSQPDYWDWNAFDHLVIVPSPSVGFVFAGCLLLALERRRAA